MTPRHRIRFAIVILVVAGLASGTTLLVDRLVTPAELEDSLAPVQSPPVSVEVQRRVVTTALVGRGMVSYEDEASIALPILPGLAGSIPLLTWLPEPGDELRFGDVIVGVAYRPVILLEGEAPLVRDLTIGDRGPDVAMLQRALAGIGSLDETDIDESFGAVTAKAVAALYEAVGYPPPTRSRRVYGPAAELRITGALPLIVRAAIGAVGEAVAPGQPVVAVSSPVAHLVVGLPSFETELLIGDEAVMIVDDVTGDITTGHIQRVGAAPDPEVGGVPVVVSYEGVLPNDRDYRVIIEVQTTGESVLAVPETALYLGVDDTSYVLRVADGELEVVPVAVGIVGTDGFTQITPSPDAQLDAGDRVFVGPEP